MRHASYPSPLVLLAGLVCLAFGGGNAQAQPIDPHTLYEQRCAGCHDPHARDFANASLRREDGRPVGIRSGAALGPLLANHRGTSLAAPEIAALSDHFAAILAAGGLYRTKCEICHDRAVRLARLRLAERDGRLIGRYTGRDVEAFMANHGRLTIAEYDVILSMLRRQLATTAE